jgi:hypothetical protein
MTKLRETTHREQGTPVIEIHEDGQLIGVIYPADKGVRIFSPHLTRGEEHCEFTRGSLPALTIRILK